MLPFLQSLPPSHLIPSTSPSQRAPLTPSPAPLRGSPCHSSPGPGGARSSPLRAASLWSQVPSAATLEPTPAPPPTPPAAIVWTSLWTYSVSACYLMCIQGWHVQGWRVQGWHVQEWLRNCSQGTAVLLWCKHLDHTPSLLLTTVMHTS